MDQGADAIITQLFFDNEHFYRYVEDVRKIGINIPIIPGIMPIRSSKQILRITKLCGSKIPADLEAKLNAVASNDSAAVEVGIDQALRQCQDLLQFGVPGIHFYCLNQSHSVTAIINSLNLP